MERSEIPAQLLIVGGVTVVLFWATAWMLAAIAG